MRPASPAPASLASASFDFSGRTVLITGGTNGIGRGVANAFAAAGARVVVTGTRPADTYDDDFAGLEVRRFAADDPTGADALVAGLDRLDVLVNNAGTMHREPSELTPAGFEATIAVNLTGAFRV